MCEIILGFCWHTKKCCPVFQFFFQSYPPYPFLPQPSNHWHQGGFAVVKPTQFLGNQICCKETAPNRSSAASTVLVRTPICWDCSAQSCLVFLTATDSSLPITWITVPITKTSFHTSFVVLTPRKKKYFLLAASWENKFPIHKTHFFFFAHFCTRMKKIKRMLSECARSLPAHADTK